MCGVHARQQAAQRLWPDGRHDRQDARLTFKTRVCPALVRPEVRGLASQWNARANSSSCVS
jgi:hypothetical protein